VTGYRVSWKSGSGSGSRDVGAGTRNVTISGLTNGVRYTISVAASNKAGRGAAAAATPVTPIGAAGAPNVLPIYDDSNGNALVNWSAPNLNGGTLVHYLVDATGMTQKTATGTSLAVAGLPHDGRQLVFTVKAVTKAPDGHTVTGATGTFTVPGSSQPSGRPGIHITRGPANCQDHPDEDACAQMHVVMTGFEPNKRYTVSAHSSDSGYDPGVDHEKTDDDGNVTFDTFQYYGVGDSVWVTVGSVESNHMTWQAS
jgi:hypothetical protein